MITKSPFGFIFFADDGKTGIELWASDGSTKGTTLLQDINPSNPSATQHFSRFGSHNMVSGGTLYFAANDGVNGEDLDMIGLGFTLGYHINENIQLTAGYLASVNDSAPTDLRMDSFKLSLVFGWHPLVEGMKRLGSE